MRKYYIILLLIVIASIAKQSYAQTDSTKKTLNRFDNYYAPWHRTINDTSKWNVSKFGHYFSVGFGIESVNGIAGSSIIASYSLAYKSHLFSLIGNGGAGGNLLLLNTNEPAYTLQNIGLLFGESLRYKHLILSLSAGIAHTSIFYFYGRFVQGEEIYFVKSGISFPIELKALLLARNGVGIGIYISESIATTTKYSPFSFGGYLVFGKWNKHKK
ncbi:MAG: hypothetical protein ACYDCN_03035 [Bacteroidia bacterium]